MTSKNIGRVLAAAAIVVAAGTATAGPAMAAAPHVATQAGKPVPGPAPANETRLSHTAQNAWATWNKGGGDAGTGIAQLLSSIVVGIPTLFTDLVQSVVNTNTK